MNVYRVLGDLSHLLSFIFLFRQLYQKRTAEGISLKSLELYALVFVCRYLDVFNFYSVYNTLFKFFYIISSTLIIYLFRFREPWKSSYQETTKKPELVHQVDLGPFKHTVSPPHAPRPPLPG